MDRLVSHSGLFQEITNYYVITNYVMHKFNYVMHKFTM